MTPQDGDWRELAEKVSQETDPDKLEMLIDELNSTLDRDERRRRRDAGSAQQSSQEQKAA